MRIIKIIHLKNLEEKLKKKRVCINWQGEGMKRRKLKTRKKRKKKNKRRGLKKGKK